MDNILGKRIELERTRLGLNQIDLAKKLGLSSSASISQYENGDRIPSDDIKIKMSEIFGCSLDYLMGKSNIRNPEDDENYSFAYHKETEGLSEEEIKDALNFYREMKNKINKKDDKDNGTK